MTSIAMIMTLTIPGLYTIFKRHNNINIPPAPPHPIPSIKPKVIKHTWKYFDFDHYDMSRDADKRLYIDWGNRDKNVKWWKEQYVSQYGRIF
tara:strand:- start:334 stop:609 length:276 start_codon:yes stop_codon:yes gene_type:complete